ncbi:MAG: peroxidase family protein [Candidatus Rokuibacteriota bacterium]
MTMNRRTFLGALGAGAMASGASGLLAPNSAVAQRSRPRAFVIREDRFGRMFPGLRAFADSSPRLLNALREIGKPGGMLDAKDDLAAGPINLIVNPDLSRNNPDNPTHTAGTTFMGQFFDHDLTFDLTSRLGVPVEPTDSPNERTPALDLDSVYGGGPLADPELYVSVGRQSRERPTKLKLEHGGLFEDLPRRADGSAIIADPRNDENMMISGLQAAFIKFHNNAVDLVARDRRASSEEIFRKARDLTTWHYQWMIVHEFLPQFIGQPLVDDILRRGRRAYRPSTPFIPVEFQGAAYRFGHSMVRPSYRANLLGDVNAAGGPAPFFGMIFDPAGEGQPDPVDLRGFTRARRRFIGWQTFFDFGAEPRPRGATGTLAEDMRRNKIIDTRISTPLFNLPLATIASGDPPTSLPQRNLLRHVTWLLPSGQRIARELDVPSLSSRDFPELRDFRLGLEDSTPLWYYVLREAQVMANGLTLGPVGGRIVGEVFLGLLQLDRDSYFGERNWRPALPTRSGRVTGDFKMVDFLAFAGVDPAHRGQ